MKPSANASEFGLFRYPKLTLPPKAISDGLESDFRRGEEV